MTWARGRGGQEECWSHNKTGPAVSEGPQAGPISGAMGCKSWRGGREAGCHALHEQQL